VSDTFGLLDNNPALIIDQQRRLWLIRVTLLDVLQWAWGSSLVLYKISSDYQQPGPPRWEKEALLVPHIHGLEEIVHTYAQSQKASEVEDWLKTPMMRRPGWMPRAHPLVLEDGTLLLPLGNENFNAAAMALTHDGGQTWVISNPVPGMGISQPSLVRLASGKLAAFFRDEGSDRQIKRSESEDEDLTWSAVKTTQLPNPSNGIEAVMFRDGHLEERVVKCRLLVSRFQRAGTTVPRGS
jgi:hypothetical protein